MLRLLVRIALRLVRLAGETLFCFEVNRFLGRAVRGPIRYRLRALPAAEAHLLAAVRAPLARRTVVLPGGLRLHTLIAGPCAAALLCVRDARRRGARADAAKRARVTDLPLASDPARASCCPACAAAGAALDVGANPVVLLHGHSMAAAHFFANVDDLLAQGYTAVLAPDLPGWGRSSRPRFQGTTADQAVAFYVRPLLAWLDALHLHRFALLGHSLGAYVAHELALAQPARVSRLILAAPAAISRHTPLATALWFAVTPQRFLTHGGLIAHVMFALRYPTESAYNVAGFRDFTLFANSVSTRSGDAAAARMLRFVRDGRATNAAPVDAPAKRGRGHGLVRWRGECARPLIDRVRRLDCEVRLVVGDRDDLVDVADVARLHDRLRSVGNRVQLHIIRGADHSPHICAPDAFAKALLGGSAVASGGGAAAAAVVAAADAAGRRIGSVVQA